MKIAAVEVYGYELTYAHGEYVMSQGRAAQSQASTLVRILTDDGREAARLAALICRPLQKEHAKAFASWHLR